MKNLLGSSSLLVLVTCLLAQGCTQEVSAESEAGQDESAIVGGRKVSSTDPIARTTVSILDPSPEVGQFCTGIVLDRELVLSAAHCFDDPDRVPHVRLGAGGALIPVRRVAVHSQYSKARRRSYDRTIEGVESASQVTTPSTPLSDLAVLWLESPLPEAASPAVLSSPSDLASAQLVSAGFGCTTTACKGQGDVLRKVTVRFVKTAPAANLLVLSAGARHGTCFGDSGGPDFAVTPRGLEVVAMISTGPEACEAGISVDTLLAPYTGWIQRSGQSLRAGRGVASARVLDF